jgi:hypothetical protein
MFHAPINTSLALGAALLVAVSAARAHDETKYPDWSGQWQRPPGLGFQWDQTKPMGLGQQAPLTAEYQKILQESLADQNRGGQGENARYSCFPSGMPRIMALVGPAEFAITPKVTYIYFENTMPRRIYTDGRSFPDHAEPSFDGYSIGRWTDEDGDGRYDLLDVETRNMKGPRTIEASGLPLHKDTATIVKERISLDPNAKDTLQDVITTFDHAFTRPWTVTKKYTRAKKVLRYEFECNENNNHVVIEKENYFLSADGLLMPTRQGQPPPDLRYFDQTVK